MGREGNGGQGPARWPKLISDSWIDTISHMRAIWCALMTASLECIKVVSVFL